MITHNPHSVSNFNPSEYEVLNYIDNQRPRYMGGPIEGYTAMVNAWRAEIAHYFPTSRIGGLHNHTNVPQQLGHNIHKCTHCGNTNVRYIVAVKHLPTGQNLVFGDICVGHLGFTSHNAFRAEQMRARAAQRHANWLIWNKRCAFLDGQPALKAVLRDGTLLQRPVHANNAFLRDVLGKLDKYGSLSERQVEAVLRAIERDETFVQRQAEREQVEAARRLTAQPAPSGRVAVEGQVLSVKSYDGMRGITWKMLVLLTTGSKVFVSVPSSFTTDDLRGKKVKLTATFTPSPTDPLFAFGKRPSNAALVD